MTLKTDVMVQLPGSAGEVAKRSKHDLEKVKKSLSNAKNKGHVRSDGENDRGAMVYDLTDNGRLYLEEHSSNGARLNPARGGKRKYTRRKKKKVKKIGILLQLDMHETRLQAIEAALGMES